jgi:hypothetical protein
MFKGLGTPFINEFIPIKSKLHTGVGLGHKATLHATSQFPSLNLVTLILNPLFPVHVTETLCVVFEPLIAALPSQISQKYACALEAVKIPLLLEIIEELDEQVPHWLYVVCETINNNIVNNKNNFVFIIKKF